MEKFSERIEDLNCRDDVKVLLKKCLFRMVAAESVESEISFLSEMRLVLDKPSSEEGLLFQSDEMKELSSLVREMYEIAIDKQIDQDYHKSSRYIDHLNVLDDRFRLYALSTVSTYPDEIMRQIHSPEINLYNREEFEERRGDNQDERDEDEEKEENDNQNEEEEEEHINLPNRTDEYGSENDSENEDAHEILPHSFYRQYEELDQIYNIPEESSEIVQNEQQERGDNQEEEKEFEQKNDNILEKDTYEQLISRRASWFTREVSSNIQWPSDLEQLHRYPAQEEEENTSEQS